MKRLLETALLLSLLALAACSGKPETGPATVRWDKVSCARCIMAVSDHAFSAQIRGGATGQKTKVYFFDDLGCAVLWLEKQAWHDDPRTEMWVNDYQGDDKWLDAFKAYYVPGQVTPMDYGLGAESDSTAGALNYEQAVVEIHTRETELH